jgi:hypothetical protein
MIEIAIIKQQDHEFSIAVVKSLTMARDLVIPIHRGAIQVEHRSDSCDFCINLNL